MAKPNIVFILIDDMGWRDLVSFGSDFYETPNIDALARDGMLFTDAYAACPVCSPTRASLMSGKYPATIGVTNFINHKRPPYCGTFGRPGRALVDAPYVKQLPLTEVSLALTLRDAGYQTWHVGKWHLGLEDTFPERHGFDRNIGGQDWGKPRRGYFSPYGMRTLPDGPEGEYLIDRLTDEAISLIMSSDGRPFFLNLWHYAVHMPIQAPAALVEKYERKRTLMGLDKKLEIEAGERHPAEQFKEHTVQRRRVQSDPAYAAMIENLDTNIGRILDTLARRGLEDDTIVIFTSDNGGCSTDITPPTSNFPLAEGKGWMYEGGVRVPLIVRWPGHIEPGAACRDPITSPDFYPTLLELADLPALPGQHTDGVSFAPALFGEAHDRGAMFWHYPHYTNEASTPGAAVRRGDWKLIEFYETGGLELYNLRDDLGEQNNRADDFPELTRELHRLLSDWREDIGAKMPAAREV